MGKVSIYLNFQGETEQALNFYASVFGSEVTNMSRFGDVPMPDGAPSLPDDDLAKVLHAELALPDGTLLMATDMLESMGQAVRIGNNTTINVDFDEPADAARTFDLLAEGSTEMAPMQEMFWGQHWGCALDRFGIRWMITAPLAR